MWTWLYVMQQVGSAHWLVTSVCGYWNCSTITGGWYNSQSRFYRCLCCITVIAQNGTNAGFWSPVCHFSFYHALKHTAASISVTETFSQFPWLLAWTPEFNYEQPGDSPWPQNTHKKGSSWDSSGSSLPFLLVSPPTLPDHEVYVHVTFNIPPHPR